MSSNAANSDQIVVVSHVGRDLLQSAAVFKHERLVVWEYVSNGLQYRDRDTAPVVRVVIDHRSKKITVADNGRGMSWADLRNFFVMHGENIDRKQGRPGRGFFGTGKAAAFGIAGRLCVTTVKSGKRSRVELRRSAVEAMSSTDPIPVSTIEREVATHEKNGTIVEIDDIHLRKIDQADIIRFIERHIARWPNATVYVNNHLCEFTEPPIARIVRFKPDAGPIRDALGETELVIKISKTPLDDEQQGIAILSNGVWHETTLAGSERKEMANYIFGDLDVPALSSDVSPIAAFDLSRSMQLNRSNELVQKIFAFIGFHVEAVRRELIEEEKKRRASEEAKQLAREASQIAQIINEDFLAYKARISKARAQAAGGLDIYASAEPAPPSDSESDFIFGDQEPAVEVLPTGSPGTHEEGGGGNGDLPHVNPQVEPTATGELKGKRAPRDPSRSQARGGFEVKFANMGDTEKRAKYDGESRTIYINLDHAQIKAALGSGGIDDIAFRRLAYEVAFSEYAVAVAYEMVKANYFLDLYEPITEIRETVNRVAVAAAHLYGSTN